jgi:hypothetical protein
MGRRQHPAELDLASVQPPAPKARVVWPPPARASSHRGGAAARLGTPPKTSHTWRRSRPLHASSSPAPRFAATAVARSTTSSRDRSRRGLAAGEPQAERSLPRDCGASSLEASSRKCPPRRRAPSPAVSSSGLDAPVDLRPPSRTGRLRLRFALEECHSSAPQPRIPTSWDPRRLCVSVRRSSPGSSTEDFVTFAPYTLTQPRC